MTTFENGPAAGQTLMLKRCPVFLRVVRNSSGEVDALDQLDDEPAADEAIFAYRTDGTTGTVHIRKKFGGGFYPIADYRIVENQPSDEIMRSSQKWAEWCKTEFEQKIS
jgi:hypothetical protein